MEHTEPLVIHWDQLLDADRRVGTTPPNPYRGWYGKRIPTGLMIRHNGRWHRVYLASWGMTGVQYIRTKEGQIVVR